MIHGTAERAFNKLRMASVRRNGRGQPRIEAASLVKINLSCDDARQEPKILEGKGRKLDAYPEGIWIRFLAKAP